MNALGSYIMEYFKIDLAGNVGKTYRTVNIVDTTPPVVTIFGSSVVSGEAGIPFVDDGAYWEDAHD